MTCNTKQQETHSGRWVRIAATAQPKEIAPGIYVSDTDGDCATCLLELRNRIEALESAANYRQQDEDIERVVKSARAGSLVERAMDAMDDHAGVHRYAETRSAIREVAAWLIDSYSDAEGCINSQISVVIGGLEQEAER